MIELRLGWLVILWLSSILFALSFHLLLHLFSECGHLFHLYEFGSFCSQFIERHKRFLHKLSKKGPDFKPMIIDVRATSRLKSRIRIQIEENLFMKSRNGSFSSYRIFARAIAAKWCGLLITCCASNCVTSVTKESIEFLSRWVYQWSVAPFKVVGNTRHMIASSLVNKFICVTNGSTCSSGSKSLS